MMRIIIKVTSFSKSYFDIVKKKKHNDINSDEKEIAE